VSEGSRSLLGTSIGVGPGLCGKLNCSKSQQLVTNSPHRRSRPEPDRTGVGLPGLLSIFDRGYARELCINEPPRISLLGTWVNTKPRGL
jgi:hypothetical protein